MVGGCDDAIHLQLLSVRAERPSAFTHTRSLKSGISSVSSQAVSLFAVTASSSAFINIQTGGNSSIIHGQVVFGVENTSVPICVCEDAPGRKEGGSRGGGSTQLTQREF